MPARGTYTAFGIDSIPRRFYETHTHRVADRRTVAARRSWPRDRERGRRQQARCLRHRQCRRHHRWPSDDVHHRGGRSGGQQKPVAIGQLAGAKVESYVWPTSLDPAVAGFDPGSGILSLAITAHPDFDDTPLYDEDRDGDPANDGAEWHSHWVVLVPDAACGAGLKVRDVSPGVDLLPDTAPYLPIALDSPGMSPLLSGGDRQDHRPGQRNRERVVRCGDGGAADQRERRGPAAVRDRRTRHRLRRPVDAGPRHREPIGREPVSLSGVPASS